MLASEAALHAAGYRTIVGMDEVGRGALAGPIVAAAVVLPSGADLHSPPWSDVSDSKTLAPGRRASLATHILERARHVTIAEIDAPYIDEVGIGAANRLVMEIALRDIERNCVPDFVLIDALTIDHSLPQIGLIDGDARSMSIAAASIVAKVHRDTIMCDLAGEWPRYAWERNKGYGVAAHLDALRTAGPSRHHRQSFRPVRECGAIQHG